MPDPKETALVEITSEMVASYIGNNHVQPGDLPALISSVHATLSNLAGARSVAPAPESEKLTPAVPIKKSITPDYLISLEDGRKLKSMKRYLAGLGMTPAEYRAKWGTGARLPCGGTRLCGQAVGIGQGDGTGRPAP